MTRNPLAPAAPANRASDRAMEMATPRSHNSLARRSDVYLASPGAAFLIWTIARLF